MKRINTYEFEYSLAFSHNSNSYVGLNNDTVYHVTIPVFNENWGFRYYAIFEEHNLDDTVILFGDDDDGDEGKSSHDVDVYGYLKIIINAIVDDDKVLSAKLQLFDGNIILKTYDLAKDFTGTNLVEYIQSLQDEPESIIPVKSAVYFPDTIAVGDDADNPIFVFDSESIVHNSIKGVSTSSLIGDALETDRFEFTVDMRYYGKELYEVKVEDSADDDTNDNGDDSEENGKIYYDDDNGRHYLEGTIFFVYNYPSGTSIQYVDNYGKHYVGGNAYNIYNNGDVYFVNKDGVFYVDDEGYHDKDGNIYQVEKNLVEYYNREDQKYYYVDNDLPYINAKIYYINQHDGSDNSTYYYSTDNGIHRIYGKRYIYWDGSIYLRYSNYVGDYTCLNNIIYHVYDEGIYYIDSSGLRFISANLYQPGNNLTCYVDDDGNHNIDGAIHYIYQNENEFYYANNMIYYINDEGCHIYPIFQRSSSSGYYICLSRDNTGLYCLDYDEEIGDVRHYIVGRIYLADDNGVYYVNDEDLQIDNIRKISADDDKKHYINGVIYKINDSGIYYFNDYGFYSIDPRIYQDGNTGAYYCDDDGIHSVEVKIYEVDDGIYYIDDDGFHHVQGTIYSSSADSRLLSFSDNGTNYFITDTIIHVYDDKLYYINRDTLQQIDRQIGKNLYYAYENGFYYYDEDGIHYTEGKVHYVVNNKTYYVGNGVLHYIGDDIPDENNENIPTVYKDAYWTSGVYSLKRDSLNSESVWTLLSLPFSTTVWHYKDNILQRKFFLESIERISEFQFTFNCISFVGLLDTQTHYGGLYSSYQSISEVNMDNTLLDVLVDIILSNRSSPYNEVGPSTFVSITETQDSYILSVGLNTPSIPGDEV